MALLGGADLVLELPVRYAAGSAEYFARGACSLLASLNVTDTLCFGCETEDPAAFSALSSLLADEPEAEELSEDPEEELSEEPPGAAFASSE